ncbi:MAG: hypothetical protein JOZ69_25830 [Myxococcales bacterium]|nr:hypothetical protein [Myxococcales bacterium]
MNLHRLGARAWICSWVLGYAAACGGRVDGGASAGDADLRESSPYPDVEPGDGSPDPADSSSPESPDGLDPSDSPGSPDSQDAPDLPDATSPTGGCPLPADISPGVSCAAHGQRCPGRPTVCFGTVFYDALLCAYDDASLDWRWSELAQTQCGEGADEGTADDAGPGPDR